VQRPPCPLSVSGASYSLHCPYEDLSHIRKYCKKKFLVEPRRLLTDLNSVRKRKQSVKYVFDMNCLPGSGSILAMVQTASQRTPDIICGKPNRPMFDALVSKYNINPHKTLMIGDRSVVFCLLTHLNMNIAS